MILLYRLQGRDGASRAPPPAPAVPAHEKSHTSGSFMASTFAVWAAHADTDPDAVETLQHALTYGLEHGYEAILESAFAADPGRAYAELAHFDYIFDNQKDKALKKFWNSGLKAVPRANPG